MVTSNKFTMMPSIAFFGAVADGSNVVIHHDGTIEIKQPEKIDDAAQQFLSAVGGLLKHGYVVRKKGVNEFLQVRLYREYVQDVEEATHFARRQDAEGAVFGDQEVVPASKAMVF